MQVISLSLTHSLCLFNSTILFLPYCLYLCHSVILSHTFYLLSILSLSFTHKFSLSLSYTLIHCLSLLNIISLSRLCVAKLSSAHPPTLTVVAISCVKAPPLKILIFRFSHIGITKRITSFKTNIQLTQPT